jgi:hypothetical protein
MSVTFCDKASENDGIIAYPSPFIPGTQMLKISYPDGVASPVLNQVSIKVMDINGDEVFQSTFDVTTIDSLNPIIWNGRNDDGDYVGAGEYSIRIITQNTKTGYYSESTINVLAE